MIELRKEDMLNVNGGANAILITTIIGTIITFIVVSHRENNTDLYDRVIRLRGKNNDR